MSRKGVKLVLTFAAALSWACKNDDVRPKGSAGSGRSEASAAVGRDTTGPSSSARGASWPFPARVTKPRILIIGDSISAGPGCYKKYLLKHLEKNGYSDFEFVGPYEDDCGGGVRHGAVSCATAEQYTRATFTMPNCFQGVRFRGLPELAAAYTPDLVLVHLGVNDVWHGRPTAAILDSYTTLVQQARAQNPDVVLVVAQIPKFRPDCTNAAITRAAEALAMAVPAWARRMSTARSPVLTADLWTSSDWSRAETTDCVHPNDVGARKMGQNWYDALKGILGKQ